MSLFVQMHSDVDDSYGKVAVCVPMAGPVSRPPLGILAPSDPRWILFQSSSTPDASRPD